jgi:Ig-like domain CHU_C associated
MPRYTLLILLVLGFLKLSAQNTTQFLDAAVIINGTSSGLGTTFGGNLGTFSCSQSLSLDGFTATTQQCGNCKINATVLAYRVNKIGETTANFSFVNNSNSSTLTEVTGCLPIVWEKTAYNHNLLNGLSDGIYTLEIYVIAQGENCDNNSAETGRFSANFMVENPLSVTKPSLLATPACRGKSFTLNATTSGATYYEWQKKENDVWQTISGENGAATETISLNFSGIYAPTLFRAVVRNCSNLNEKISDEMEVSPQSPQISVQPINLTNCLGQDVFFKTSSPSNTARYQWQWSNNGAGFVNLSATTHYVAPTSNELKLNDLLSGDHEDAFRCIITDANGCTDTTQAAMVFVNRKSSILAEESTICEGKTNALTARSLYGNIETYQWQLRNTAGAYENLTESVDIVGVTEQQLHLFSVPKANTHYRVSMAFSSVSMDNNGMPQATTCLLTETKNFIIHPRPASPVVSSFPERCGEGTIALQAPQTATSYRWYADTTATHLATNALFSPTVTASQSFFLSNIDAKSCESYRTEIPVTVHAVPQLSVETWDEICPSATSFSLSYNATISDSVFIKSTELTGFHGFKEEANLSSIEIPIPDNSLSGNYLFKINTKNNATNCTSEEKEFTLKIKEKTSISIDITADTLCEATPFSFVATATGAGTLGYQWLKNNEEISGETFSSFTKSSANTHSTTTKRQHHLPKQSRKIFGTSHRRRRTSLPVEKKWR